MDDGQSSAHSISRSFVVTVVPVNQPPTLDPLTNVNLPENTFQTEITLTGLSSGAPNENQLLTVTASSSNPALIPNPVVNVNPLNPTASLVLKPVANRTGTATITVAVDDGEAYDHITTRSFIVTVVSFNQPPTLGPLTDVTILEDSGTRSMALYSISSGAANESQTITLSAVSSNPDLIPNPAVAYVSPNASGTLSFAPVANASGTAVITVTANDGHALNNTISRSFQVTVSAVNDPPALNPIANLIIDENSASQTVNLSGISAGPQNEQQPLTITAVSSDRALIPDPAVNYQSPNSTGSLVVTPARYASGTATITVTVNDGQTDNNKVIRSFTITVNPVNQPPTLSPIANLALDSNAGQQVVQLSGISSGLGDAVQSLAITATSSNPAIVPNPIVNYASPSTTGTIVFTPANTSGSAIITVTVNDGQSANSTFSRSFVVTVNLANQAPTLASIADLTIDEDTGIQTVTLTGITTGSTLENQVLKVTAVSSNPEIIPNPIVSYFSPGTVGGLTFVPVANAFGTATITVTVDDGYAINNTVTRSFQVKVLPLNDPPSLNTIGNITINENAGAQVINLVGISAGANEVQALTLTATSSDPSIIPNPTVKYVNPSSGGTLTFTPAANAFGSATITVTVNDGESVQNTVSRSFLVVVNPVNQPPTLQPLADLGFDTGAGEVTVPLYGISSGAANESQTLTVTALSSNPAIVPNPTVSYSSPSSSGSLLLRPGTLSGTATITVTVNDGQTANNLFSRSFDVTINAANHPPTLSPLSDLTFQEDAPLQTVRLYGISSGSANETQNLTVVAVSSNPELIPNPVVAYSNPDSIGTLSFVPAPNMFGTATVTVTVDDGNVLNSTISRSFNVVVVPVNDPPTLNSLQDVVINQDSDPWTVNLSGISAGPRNEYNTLTVVAQSSDIALIPHPVAHYSNPDTAGTLTLSPAPNAFGSCDHNGFRKRRSGVRKPRHAHLRGNYQAIQ